MFSSNPIEINKSSLVSLKAEILRKQQELKANKQFERPVPKPIFLKKKKETQGKDGSGVYVEDEEDRELLAKSKQILESKAKLYSSLSKESSKLSAREREISKRLLVQFDKKKQIEYDEPEDVEDYEAKNSDEEWVEYVDALGRTRKCLQKDLDYMKRKDRDLSESIEGSGRLREEPKKFVKETEKKEEEEEVKKVELSEENELLSSDMRREILRIEWEKQEEELLKKKDVHYQDLLFNEARSHGVGYYAFSHDEEERAKQQENLKKLREETKQQQKTTSELKAMREKQLADRLKAARNRKRLRMGLPPEEDEPEQSAGSSKKEDEEEKEKLAEKEAEEKQKQEERARIVRPWDIGKEILKKHHEYSQEEWVTKKRQERPTDFAPPSSYHQSKKYNPPDDFKTKKSLYFTSKKHKEEKTVRNINPYLNSSTDSDDEQSEATQSKRSKIQDSAETSYVSPFIPPDPLQPTYDSGVILPEENKVQSKKRLSDDDQRYSPSFSMSDSSDSEEEIVERKSKSVPKIDPSALEESVMAGLKYLREKTEKQSKKTRDEDFIT